MLRPGGPDPAGVGTGSDGGTMIVVDGAGHPIIAGAFAGTADLGGTTLLSAGSSDVFLMRLNP